MASTAVGVQRYMKLFAWLPAALHPGIEKALLLCFGVGSTASALTALPDLQRIDVVDTSRDILEMSHVVFPDPATQPLRDPRVHVHVEDARFYLQLTRERYDLITGEPPPPKIAGVAALYSREYFALMRSRLKPGGIASYWLPSYLLLEHETLAIVRAFCDAFEDCSLWAGFNLDWILVGSNGGIAPVPRERFARLWTLPNIGEELRRLGIDGPEQLAGQFMADAATLKAMSAAVPPLDDDHPRRVRAALYPEGATPAYRTLLDATRGRSRLEASRWASVLPVDGREGFQRRTILDAAFNPGMRGAEYSFWANVTYLLKRTDLVELPRWLLGSGTRAVEIAKMKGPGDPIAAEHREVDTLVHRRAPVAVDMKRYAALQPWGQVLTAFHHCLAGDSRGAWALLRAMRSPDPDLQGWAKSACPEG
jgi:spermidine synthase